MVRTGGAEGEAKRKRMPSLWQYREKLEGETRREEERKREKQRPDVLSWSTYFVVDEASHFFVFTSLCFVISANFPCPKTRKRQKTRPLIYIRDSSKIVGFTSRWVNTDEPPLCIFFLFLSGKKKRNLCEDLNATRTICCAICMNIMTNEIEFERIGLDSE